MRILFIHNHPTRFVKLDIALLERQHHVTEFYLRSKSINPLVVARQIQQHDIVLGWFASWHTFIPMLLAKLLRKPSILIVGGYDLANLPEAGYGHQRGGLKKWVSRATMALATTLVTNAYYSQREAEENAGIPADRLNVVYHGVPDLFGSLPQKNGQPLVLTVGNVWQENLWRKGLEPFVQAAAHLPDVHFVLVGAWRDDSIDYLQSIAPSNVTFTDWVEEEDLLDYYRRAHVYVQASAHEGFGMSVAEAMLAGCIPVVTRRGALPEVVGRCGYVVDNQDPAEIAVGIKSVLAAPSSQRHEVRRRVLENFTLEKRQLAFENLLRPLINGSS